MTKAITPDQADNIAPALDVSSASKSTIGWKAALLLIAAMPFLHTAATWDQDGHITTVNQILRLYSLPIVWIELIILWWATRLGWRPTKHFSDLPTIAKRLCVALAISVMISTIIASNAPFMSALFVARYLLHIFLASSLMFLTSRDSGFDLNRWAASFSWGAALYVISLAIFCLLVTQPQEFRWVERIPSATNVRQIGNVLGLLTLAPTMLLIVRGSNTKLATTALLLIALMTFIMWTGTRGALLGFAIAVSIAAVRSWHAIDGRRTILLAILCLFALTISVLIPAPAPEFGIIRIAESFSAADSLSGRWHMWQTTFEAIKAAPFFGHGAGTYRDNMVLLNGYPFNHPHNFILQFVYDWGMIGGGIILALLVWLGFALLSSNKGRVEERFLAIAGFVSLITMALIEGTLFHPLPMVIAVAFISPHLARRQA